MKTKMNKLRYCSNTIYLKKCRFKTETNILLCLKSSYKNNEKNKRKKKEHCQEQKKKFFLLLASTQLGN